MVWYHQATRPTRGVLDSMLHRQVWQLQNEKNITRLSSKKKIQQQVKASYVVGIISEKKRYTVSITTRP